MFCEGLKNVLQKKAEFQDIKLFHNGHSLLNSLDLRQPNIILGDISMPEMDGIELLRKVKSKFPAVKYIIISTYNSFGYIKEVMKEGADGFVTKDSDSLEVI